MNKQIYNRLPKTIKTILLSSDTAFLVGSSIDKLSNDEKITDYDIIIDNREDYLKTVRMLTATEGTISLNSFGGIKLNTKDGLTVDVWCNSLAEMLTRTDTKSFYCLRNQKLYTNIL